MERLVTIIEVGAYSERQHRTWQDQNGQTRHENMFYITDIQTL